jgi:hypothetical protein
MKDWSNLSDGLEMRWNQIVVNLTTMSYFGNLLLNVSRKQMVSWTRFDHYVHDSSPKHYCVKSICEMKIHVSNE